MNKHVETFELTLIPKNNRPGQLEILRQMVVGLGVKEDQIIEFQKDGESRLIIYLETSAKALSLKNNLKKMDLKDVSIASKSLKGKDWQNIWKKDFKPFQLTKRFDIVPYSYRGKYKAKNREFINIDTSFAFGTGLHATTRFMAQFIEEYEGKYSSFIDIGTGTGILSIIALKCGAKKVTAIDLTKGIIDVANMNFRENGHSRQRGQAINFEKFKTNKKYDYVAANLITIDLIHFRKKLVSLVNREKYLAVSGISVKNYPLFHKKFASLPLKCIKLEKADGWCALLYKKI
ncbi:MAG: 50S ribosomal protein L11 methyltransferase [Candidatus Omnitrophica bacterium]|nr:50S ribosomal protein L11 methyltransferase [Candidatus Omnitrophota bacterium]